MEELQAVLFQHDRMRALAELNKALVGRACQLGEGTHTVMLEKNRMQFFHEILGFLDESDATALK